MIHLTLKTYSLAAAIDHAASKNADMDGRHITAGQLAELAAEHGVTRGRVRNIAAALLVKAPQPGDRP